MISATAKREADAPRERAPERLEQIFLGVLVIQPSPFCNINCDYCYLPNRTSKQRMSMDTLRRVMERVWESGLVGPEFQLLWHAGEPLAVPVDWYEEAFRIIGEFPDARDTVIHTFQSNGTLLNERWCHFLREHQVEIGLSIDGPAFVHDEHRKTRNGAGTHAKAERGARLLQEHGIPFGVVAVISDYSLNYADEIFRYFVDLGIDGVGFNIEEVEGVNEDSSLDPEAELRIWRFLKRIYDLNEAEGFPLRVREFEIARENILDPRTNQGVDGSYFNLETNPLAMLNVDCLGNVSTFSPELLGQETKDFGTFHFGHVDQGSLFELTQSEAFRRVYADVREGNRICAESCPYWSVCGGASPSNKYYENGTFASGETQHCRSMIQMPLEIVLQSLETRLP